MSDEVSQEVSFSSLAKASARSTGAPEARKLSLFLSETVKGLVKFLTAAKTR